MSVATKNIKSLYLDILIIHQKLSKHIVSKIRYQMTLDKLKLLYYIILTKRTYK